jgi:ribosomal protein S18 acetylase RimI-like enzyme
VKIKSLAYMTDLFFPAFDGEIIDRGEYQVIRTPLNPDFYWGNFLLFPSAPLDNDLTLWQELFSREIGNPPEVKHKVFGWDSPSGELGCAEKFKEEGFRLNQNAVLESSQPNSPPNTSLEVEIRTLTNDSDWEKASDNQKACWPEEVIDPDHLSFMDRQMDRYRRMTESGLGDWYGAFLGDRLVADLGLFHNHEIGRFQMVETHPDFRRRGIAGKLVIEAGRQALQKFGLRKLVIVAEENSGAQRLYQSLGFISVEKQVGLEWWPDIK